MNDYTCPGCAADEVTAEFCHHTARQWEIAQALRDGVERLHADSPTTWEPDEGASYFLDDAEAIDGHVGEPPYRAVFTHPGAKFASVALINDRYLVGCDEDNEPVLTYIADIRELVEASNDALLPDPYPFAGSDGVRYALGSHYGDGVTVTFSPRAGFDQNRAEYGTEPSRAGGE